MTALAFALAAALLASPGAADPRGGRGASGSGETRKPHDASAAHGGETGNGRATEPRARGATGGAGGIEAKGTGDPRRSGAKRPAPDAGPPDPDQEVIDHLDELERLELLQHLELFDPKAPEERERR